MLKFLRSLFGGSGSAPKPEDHIPDGPKMIIVEGIEGTWHYHLAMSDEPYTAFCGRKTMQTKIPLSAWGIRSEHIPEKWCRKCAEMGGIHEASSD